MNTKSSDGNVSLRTVSSSRPQLQYVESQQSEVASDDYYSFPSSARSASSASGGGSSKKTVMGYATPNSRPVSRASSSRTHTARTHDQDRNARVRFGEDRVVHVSPRMTEDGSEAATPGEGDMPYIRYAINNLTRDDDDDMSSLGRQSSVTSEEDYPDERLVWNGESGCFTRSPISPTQQQQQTLLPRSAQSSVEPESFVAVDPPVESFLNPPLNFVPVVLRPWALSLLVLCCLLMIAGVAFGNVWSHRHQGLWGYDGQGGSRYFVMQFLPQILAAIVTIWTFVVQAAVYRIMPFAIMASERRLDRVLQEIPVLSRNFLFPDLSHFWYGEPLVGFSLFTIWLSNMFAMPLLSCLFQAKWYNTIDGQGAWRWASVESVGWTLVALYGLLTIGLLVLVIRFAFAWSGVIWDPTSLADLIPLIQRSNILRDFELSETIPDVGESLDPRIVRLGYWKLSGKQDMLFYGVGEVDALVGTPSLHRTDKSHGKQTHALSKVLFDVERQSIFTTDPTTRYRWTPWFLKDISMVTWTVLIGGLFIAFVLVSFIHDAVAGGFPPRLPTLPSTGAFSSSNFLYSFIPAFIGMLFFLAWQHVDVSFRALQPYATLSSSPLGAHAEESLLLSYPSLFPIQITLVALFNRHFKVAWISLISLLSIAIPILAGGVFIALWYPSHNGVQIVSLMPAFYTLVGFCALYTISLLCIWPSRNRYLPHDISTLADQISFLYQSPLLADKILREPRSKTDLVTRLIMAPPGEREYPAYGFGVYVGRDGREHLGIDRLRRPGRENMLVSTGSG